MNITITGTGEVRADATERWELLLEHYVAPFAKGGHEFFVGAGTGIDTLALQFLVTRRAPVTVVVPAAVDDLPDEARDRIRRAEQAYLAEVVELKDPRFPEPEAYQARDQYMVDRSALLVSYQPGQTSGEGTWSTVDYAASKDVPRLIVPL
jgi:hypothetical protein